VDLPPQQSGFAGGVAALLAAHSAAGQQDRLAGGFPDTE